MFRHPYVFDGQHTIEIVASRSGSRDTPVWCMVYDQLQYQEEAHIEPPMNASLATPAGDAKK